MERPVRAPLVESRLVLPLIPRNVAQRRGYSELTVRTDRPASKRATSTFSLDAITLRVIDA